MNVRYFYVVKLLQHSLVAIVTVFTMATSILTLGNDRGVTPHSIDQSNQFRSRVHDFHSKQFSCQQPTKYKRYIDMDA